MALINPRTRRVANGSSVAHVAVELIGSPVRTSDRERKSQHLVGLGLARKSGASYTYRMNRLVKFSHGDVVDFRAVVGNLRRVKELIKVYLIDANGCVTFESDGVDSVESILPNLCDWLERASI